MLVKHLIFSTAATFFLLTSSLFSQPNNLLTNPKADLGDRGWKISGKAVVEDCDDNPCFAVRNQGAFVQWVKLAPGLEGQYVVFFGRGRSERINSDNIITGLPYLYGYMLSPGRAEGSILAYLQGQKMLAKPASTSEWVKMWGIFEIPKGTREIQFFLNQAQYRGVPQNGSAAFFDDLGLYLFKTENEAKEFVQTETGIDVTSH